MLAQVDPTQKLREHFDTEHDCEEDRHALRAGPSVAVSPDRHQEDREQQDGSGVHASSRQENPAARCLPSGGKHIALELAETRDNHRDRHRRGEQGVTSLTRWPEASGDEDAR